MAPDRAAPEQQDPPRRRALRLGANGPIGKNRTAPLREPPGRAGAAQRPHPGECLGRGFQVRHKAGGRFAAVKKNKCSAAAQAARSDGDSRARGRPVALPGGERNLRPVKGRVRLRYAVARHVRRHGARHRRGRDAGAGRHRHLRHQAKRKDRRMKIAFLGGGNMANALIGGLLAKGFEPRSISVIEVSPSARERLAAQHGVRASIAPDAATSAADTLVLAVKPQDMRAALAGFPGNLSQKLVISIAAGLRLDALSRWLGGHRKLVRCMPNMPALIGAGITGLYALAEVSSEERNRAETVLRAVGEVVWVGEERLLDPVTAVSGSGPAYVFWFIEQLSASAIKLGIPQESALKLAVQTVLGAAKLAAQSDESPAELRKKVTSKGGTTEAALRVFDEEKLAERFARALEAASRRSAELGDELGKG